MHNIILIYTILFYRIKTTVGNLFTTVRFPTMINPATAAMKKIVFFLAILFTTTAALCQGNHVFSGGEFANFGVVDIKASGTATWSTDRNPAPGYFSAVNTATYTGCTDIANINGYVKKYGNSAFIFPVGSGSDIRTLEMTAPALSTDAYATAWIAGDPGFNADPTGPDAGLHPVTSFASPLVAVSKGGQWDWQVGEAGNLGSGTTGNGTGLVITVSIPDMITFASAANLRLVGWNGTQWIDLSGTPTATGNTENSFLTGTMQPGITSIAVGTVSLVLPLKLERFYATANNCDAIIRWTSANELNTDKFILEQSIDNIHFIPVATVKATGNSGTNEYSAVIPQSANIAYYRLKMLDIDGTFTFSNIIVSRTNCTVKEFMKVYPNPAVETGTVYLSFGTTYKGRATLMVTNTLGQRYTMMPVLVSTGNNLVPVNIVQFAAGTYFISLYDEKNQQIGSVQKFIKQ